MTRAEAFNRLRRVRDEFDAGRFALEHILGQWNSDPSVAIAAQSTGVTAAELRRCARSLELTFVLRLFAEFETILRDFWRNGIGRTTDPEMRQLIESVGRRRNVPPTDLRGAHEIREYRNAIVHDGLRKLRLDLPLCLKAVGRFLRWAPLEW